MNNKRKDKDPLFAEVKLTGDEFKQSPNNNAQRTRFLKRNCSVKSVIADSKILCTFAARPFAH